MLGLAVVGCDDGSILGLAVVGGSDDESILGIAVVGIDDGLI